jgi:hypothetical protein
VHPTLHQVVTGEPMDVAVLPDVVPLFFITSSIPYPFCMFLAAARSPSLLSCVF